MSCHRPAFLPAALQRLAARRPNLLVLVDCFDSHALSDSIILRTRCVMPCIMHSYEKVKQSVCLCAQVMPSNTDVCRSMVQRQRINSLPMLRPLALARSGCSWGVKACSGRTA